MSNLFSNLLERQNLDGNLVRPRSRARFEPDTVRSVPQANAFATVETGDDESNLDNKACEAEAINSTQSTSKQPEPTIQSRQTDWGKLEHGRQASAQQWDQLPQNEIPSLDYRTESGLENSIQNTLERLLQQSEEIRPIESKTQHLKAAQSEIVAINTRDTQTLEATLRQQPVNTNRFVDAANPKDLQPTIGEAQIQDTSIPTLNEEPQGVLEPPSWLQDLKAEFYNRWHVEDPKKDSEPVVNVTIGRVEVRAVQTETAKQPKPKQKPKGVMSLDDYLKQREHRGRA